MIRVTTLDQLAASGTSWLHHSSAAAKWLIIAAAVLTAILATSPWPLLAAYALLAGVTASCRLPLRTLLVASLLPLPLVGLYALSRWDGTMATPLTIVGKGMVTALAGLLVAATTPYPDLLAPATRVLPPVMADSLVLTYRALFLLWGRVEALWLAMRARGGVMGRPAPGVLPWRAGGTPLRRRFELGATGTALAVLRAADLSGRLYDVMRLRGYQGRLAPTRPLALRPSDWGAMAVAVALILVAALARLALR